VLSSGGENVFVDTSFKFTQNIRYRFRKILSNLIRRERIAGMTLKK